MNLENRQCQVTALCCNVWYEILEAMIKSTCGKKPVAVSSRWSEKGFPWLG